MNKTIFILLFIIIVGCSSVVHDDTEWSYASLWFSELISITDSVRVGQPVEFRLESGFGDTCWEYGYMNIEVDGSDVHIWFIRKMNMSQNGCYTVMVPYEINESIPLMPPGQYNFHFWKYGRQSIDTIVTVY